MLICLLVINLFQLITTTPLNFHDYIGNHDDSVRFNKFGLNLCHFSNLEYTQGISISTNRKYAIKLWMRLRLLFRQKVIGFTPKLQFLNVNGVSRHLQVSFLNVSDMLGNRICLLAYMFIS